MKIKVLWTRQADQDLLDIYLTIGLDNPAAAERIYTTIQEKTELLASQPRLGPRRPEIQPSTRILIERPYLILYKIRPNTDSGPVHEVTIVRVLDGRRDLPSLF
jgi:toxin ParE1/3/4